jgi:hypothetical protein
VISDNCKPFQRRFDGCNSSYNHATNLDKHKKIDDGVAQNGGVVSSVEYQEFVAQARLIAAGNREINRQKEML